MQNEDSGKSVWSRRDFLGTVGLGAPSLKLVLQGSDPSCNPSVIGSGRALNSKEFAPIDLSSYFTASSRDFGPKEQAKSIWGGSDLGGLVRTPAGEQNLRGIPFLLGPEGLDKKSWIVLTTRSNSWSVRRLEIPIDKKARFICLAAFCDWDENETPPPGVDVFEKVGQHLGSLSLVYEDGREHTFPLRRRFEVHSPAIRWGHLGFASLPHHYEAPRQLTDPLARGTDWGYLQNSVTDADGSSSRGPLLRAVWLSSLANPLAEQNIKTLRLEAADEDPLVICGLTLFDGSANPLRCERLNLYRITLTEAAAEEKDRWKVDLDLGVIARKYTLGEFDPNVWLSSPRAGLGESSESVRSRYIYVEMTASPAATLALTDQKTGKRYDFDLSKIVPDCELESQPPGVRVEILEANKVRLQGRVVDITSGRLTPVRLSFRSKEGRYIPPYGHRTEINDTWFQDYGADLKLMDTSFAYVDGTFEIELPVGEVYIEMTKGFEYEAKRQKLTIAPDQRELNLKISRFADFRSQGWVSADVHVHFLSPSTAILEGQAEGLNLINLLAAQWGDLFTNVGDFWQGPLTSRDAETMVWVGTENRQHLLGHINLLGGRGAPVYPLSAAGPSESYLGDPLWTSLAEWADACREREGVVVSPHFPYPTGEVAADIALGKIDAVELYPVGENFNSLGFLDWYHYLNCGYRLAAAGGTDKMGAYIPVGANRTYAYVAKEEFNFPSWARALRSGNTFETTGPLLLFRADGHVPGEEITLGTGGGNIEVQAEAKSYLPIHRFEIIMNGRVVASRDDSAGTHNMTLKDKISVSGPCWLAARCASRDKPETSWEQRMQAHTSPVYVRAQGQELFSTPVAAYMLTLVEGTQTWVENLATRPDQGRLARISKMLNEAQAALHRRIHHHQLQH